MLKLYAKEILMSGILKIMCTFAPQFCKNNTIFIKKYESIRNRFHFDSRFV
jgi:hypothetical protein